MLECWNATSAKQTPESLVEVKLSLIDFSMQVFFRTSKPLLSSKQRQQNFSTIILWLNKKKSAVIIDILYQYTHCLIYLIRMGPILYMGCMTGIDLSHIGVTLIQRSQMRISLIADLSRLILKSWSLSLNDNL